MHAATSAGDNEHDLSSASPSGYKDYANEQDEDHIHDATMLVTKKKTRNGTNQEQNFPVKLHYALEDMEKDGLGRIVSWMPHGRCFIVYKLDAFVKEVLPL